MSTLNFSDIATGMELIFVAGGSFDMGDTFNEGYQNEQPVHEVRISDYYIGKSPVTQGQWHKILGNNPSHFKKSDLHPVETVTMADINQFIEALRETTNHQFFIPTEAQWEYAARSRGKKERWAGTNDESKVDEYAWFDENSGGTTQPVCEKKPNELGLYDMSGNVYEWVQDTYSQDGYQHHSLENPVNKNDNRDGIIRGGSWYNYKRLLRCTDRSIFCPTYKDNYVGFRLALVK